LPALAAAGNDLIAGHIIEFRAWREDLARLLEGLGDFLAGVRCDLAEISRRERGRGYRRIGEVCPLPLLLGAFDPLLLGWASRDSIVGPHRRIVTAGGLFRPFALAGGRAVATWTVAGGQVALAPFAPLDAGTRAALDTDAADVTRFLGG
jgi:hypothetical protein